jgi:hypothetical protein
METSNHWLLKARTLLENPGELSKVSKAYELVLSIPTLALKEELAALAVGVPASIESAFSF